MDDVRALGPRLARLALATVLGTTAGAIVTFAALPRHGQDRLFCPLAIVAALACVLAFGCNAVLGALGQCRSVHALLPVARVRQRARR